MVVATAGSLPQPSFRELFTPKLLTAAVGAALDRIAERPKAFVIDMGGVRMLDTSGAATSAGLVRKASQTGQRIVIAAAAPQIRRILRHHNVRPPRVTYAASVQDAVTRRLRQSQTDLAAPLAEPLVA